MFPKFILVSLYSDDGRGGYIRGGGGDGGAYIRGNYIRDFNSVTYLGGVYSGEWTIFSI